MNWMRRRRERISGWPSCPSSASSPWYSTSLSRTRCPSFGWVSTGNDFIIKVVFTPLCSLRPNWFIRKKLTAEGCVSAAVNVLGVFQATRGKSPGAWQPETTDRESLPRFSAALAGAGHEEGSGDKGGVSYHICNGDVQQTLEEFECVTIFFGEILGFEDIVRDCTPTEVKIKFISRENTVCL